MAAEHDAFWKDRLRLGDALTPAVEAMGPGPVTTYLRGWVAAVQGRMDEALGLLGQAAEEMEHDDIWLARVQRTTGDVLGELGDDLNAERHYIEAERLFTLLGDTEGLVNTIQNSASLGYHSPASTRARLLEALDVAETLPDPGLKAIIRVNIGQSYMAESPADAEHWLRKALAITEDELVDIRARCLSLLSGIALDRGDAEAAGRYLTGVDPENPVYVFPTRVESSFALARLAAHRGDHPEAVRLLGGLLGRPMHPLQEIPILEALAEAQRQAGYLEAALDTRVRIGDLWRELHNNSATRRAHALDVMHRNHQLRSSNETAREQIGTLEQALTELQHAHEQIRHMIVTDALTGIHNRRFLLDEGPVLLMNVTAEAPAQLAMLDIDDFKLVNDTYGHHIGDRVLIKVAKLLRSHTQPGDIVVRHGGDEFVVIRSHDNPASLAEDLTAFCAELRATSMRGANDDGLIAPGLSVGASVGVLEVTRGRLEEALSAADVLMYRAKRGGGGRVVTDRQ